MAVRKETNMIVNLQYFGGRGSAGGTNIGKRTGERRGAFNYATNSFDNIDRSFEEAVNRDNELRSVFGMTTKDHADSYTLFFSNLKAYASTLTTQSQMDSLHKEFEEKIKSLNRSQYQTELMLDELKKALRKK